MAFKVREAHWQLLLELMEKYPVMATGKFVGPTGKESYRKLWEDAAKKLNALGLGLRTVEKWQKTWTDYKYNLKRKAANIKRSLAATGGGMPSESELSELDTRILDLLGESFIGLNEPEIGVLHTGESKPSTSGTQTPKSRDSTPPPVAEKGKKRKRTAESEESDMYLTEYRETIKELREIKDVLRKGLSEIVQEFREFKQIFSQVAEHYLNNI